MGMKYKDPTTGKFKEINVKVADTLPVGSEVDYNGTTIPTGWEEVDSPNEYSTDEVRIGTWMGKPLYRKVIKTTMAETSQSGKYVNKDVPIGLNIDFVYVAKAILISETQYMLLPYINNAGYSTKCFFEKSGMHLTLANGNSDFNNGETYVTLEYTKTTD